MRFQKRILLNYFLLLVISVTVIAVLYWHASERRYASEEYAYLQTLAGQMTRQLELQYSSMEEAAESLLSDPDLLDDLKILATVPEGSSYRTDAEKNINIKLNTYHIVKRYYRVVIYNETGDVFASYDFDGRKVCDTIPPDQAAWTKQTVGRGGKPVLIRPHTDTWGQEQHREVYSLLREVLGYGAYVEVQQTKETLDRIFQIYDDNIHAMAMFGDGLLLYDTGTADQDEWDSYRQSGVEGQTDVFEVTNPVTGILEIVAASYSDLTGITVLLAENKGVIYDKMSGFLWLTCQMILVFAGLSAFLMYQGSKKMARPVDELRSLMEHATLDHPEGQISIENSIDEIRAQANAYEQMITRLRESLLKEKSLSYLQLQARYDLLQAQINPHFFHNVLNVISSRGLTLGDETICEICESLSGMLRYATGNRTRYVTVREELEYLEQYLYLMKLRYRHKIEYVIEVEEALSGQKVPKIVFQQIVENSIKHGFNSFGDVMKIHVLGRLLPDRGCWEMSFSDNGEGICQEKIQEITDRMADMKKALQDHDTSIEMEFGGMGLLNTYARLFLFFGEEAEFLIDGSAGGTRVLIRAPYREPYEEEEEDVSGFGGR